MKINIEVTSHEIADLVVDLQSRQVEAFLGETKTSNDIMITLENSADAFIDRLEESMKARDDKRRGNSL
jgi:ABC-type Zn uptake system ZnuABC Zn-binding protein ZnuA